MTLETTIGRATIRFPRPIKVEEAEKMMRYIIVHGEMTIDYNKNSENTFMTASIYDPRTRCKECLQYLSDDEDNPTSFSRMKFFSIPVWSNLKQCPLEVLKLWDDVRELTNKYFTDKK